MAKVSVLPRQYADLNTAIISNVGVRANLDRHSRLRSGTAQGHQPWDVEVEIDLAGYESSDDLEVISGQ
jgi:hypothetical protein